MHCRHDDRVRNIHHLIKFKSKVKYHTRSSSQLVQLGRMAGVVVVPTYRPVQSVWSVRCFDGLLSPQTMWLVTGR